jgi:hypothetical protein
MQNQYLSSEASVQSDWNRSQTDAEASADPASSSVLGEGIPSATADLEAHQSPAEVSTVPPPEEIITTEEVLLQRLIHQADKQRKWRRISSIVYWVGVCFFGTVSCLRLYDPFSDPSFYYSLSVVLFYATVFAVGSVTRYRWKKATSKIAQFEDVRVVGALAEAINIPNKKMRAQVEAALTRLLPRLRHEDAHLLNAAQRGCLYRRLKIENAEAKPDFLVALLDVLERVGDAEALERVEKLAACAVTTANGERVQAAAQKCLPLLRLRVQTQEVSSTLLRAAGTDGMGSGSLLRPAHEESDSAPEQLLRAVRPHREPEA